MVANPDLDFFKDLYQAESQVGYTVVLDGRNKVKAVEEDDGRPSIPNLFSRNLLNKRAPVERRSP